jgi:hypothetical protein
LGGFGAWPEGSATFSKLSTLAFVDKLSNSGELLRDTLRVEEGAGSKKKKRLY